MVGLFVDGECPKKEKRKKEIGRSKISIFLDYFGPLCSVPPIGGSQSNILTKS